LVRVSPEESAGVGKNLRVPCLFNPSANDLAAHLADKTFVWVDFEGPSDHDLEELSKLVKLHPLTLEDARTFKQRPKIEDYDNYLFIVAFGVDSDTVSGGRLLREVHLIVSGDYVVTIHRTPNQALADLRKRYGDQPVRSEQFLVYRILDAVTSTFVPVLSRTDDEIDNLEQEVIANPTTDSLQRIFSLRRDLVAMRRVITPMRDMFARNVDRFSELPGLGADDRLYFRDLYDGLIRVADLVDSYRDLLSGATDMYLSEVANRQGEVNKQLTVIATIFLPLSFLTGFFGQNFAYLTNHVIDATWTFWVFGIGLLVASVVGFFIFFRRKAWIGGSSAGTGGTP